jgi:hypothetical protein
VTALIFFLRLLLACWGLQLITAALLLIRYGLGRLWQGITTRKPVSALEGA